MFFHAINQVPMAFAPGMTTVSRWGVPWKRGKRQGIMADLRHRECHIVQIICHLIYSSFPQMGYTGYQLIDQ